MKRISLLAKVLFGLASLLLLSSLISLIDTNRGIVRMLDFLREPAIYFAGLLGVVALLTVRQGRGLIIGLLVVSVAINFWRLWPYTGIAPERLALGSPMRQADCARVLSLNVLQSNDRFDRTARLIERVDPDILLLMETDERWQSALAPQLQRYPHRVARPLDNKYGMIFATRLNVDRAQMVANTSANTPTLYATLRTASGAPFEVIGLHPRPPLPGETTDSRDANIARAGAKTPDRLPHVMAIGDFNDVPWSRTTAQFTYEGDYLDPRAGRGTFATFPADWVWFGWPLDHLFVKAGITVTDFERGPDVGSDHLPIIARVCVGGGG